MTSRAYHFVGDKLRDGQPVPPDGEWLVHDGPVIMCATGLHFSRHPFDALTYAPGPVLCIVDVDDVVDEEDDKGVCRRRRIVVRRDLTRELRLFAAECARRVLHLVEPDALLACLWAIDAAERFARGECGRDELDTAYAAATLCADAAAAATLYGGASATLCANAAAADAAAYASDAHAVSDDERAWQRRRFAQIVREAFK